MATGMAAGHPYLRAARAASRAARAHNDGAMDEDEFYGYGEERYGSEDDDDDDEEGEGDSAAKKTKMEAAQYEAAHGIRRPDPVRQQRLVDDGPFYSHREDPNFIRPSHNGRGSLDPPGVSWIFAPATDLSYPGGFEEVSFLQFNFISEHFINLFIFRQILCTGEIACS
jgi:hypothetical protein